MILTDYYRFERVCTISKTRLDCVASSKSYPVFEEKRSSRNTAASNKTCAVVVGGLTAGYLRPEYVKAAGARKPEFALRMGSGKGHITSIFKPSPKTSAGYGNVKNTADALLFVFSGFEVVNGAPSVGGVMEIFVARGMANDELAIFWAFLDGELDEELEALRGKATQDPTPTGEQDSKE